LGVTRNPRLTPALRRLLVLIAEGGERGRIKREIDASGSRARLQLRTLMEAGYVEWVVEETDHRHFSECVRISDAGKQSLLCSTAVDEPRAAIAAIRLDRVNGSEELPSNPCH
jgi:hypothetical protein